VEVGSINDEPLEDLIAANTGTYQQATVGSDGTYRLATLADGTYFVTFVPADAAHLPGGSLCREALPSADLVGQRFDVVVSGATPAGASYVGSGRCVTCHGKTHIAQTLHRVGIWSPDEHGLLQDIDARFDDLYEALAGKFTPAGTTVWFYDFDATRGFDKYKTSETDPGAGASFTVTVREGAGGDFEMLLHNLKAVEADVVIRVDAVYGGGLYKQRYLTYLTTATGARFTAVMPIQYQHEGNEVNSDRTRKVWRDYHGDWWYDEATMALKTPLPKNSFEKNCVSCHASTARVTGSDATTWVAETVSDPLWGDFDFDGDGVKDEVNLGCETCHGPGSAHWEATGQGRHIVNPANLTPERDAMICGQCHSRPQGGLLTDSPVDADGWMMVAGTSRNDFLANYATKQLDGAAKDFHGDAAKHSKSHHQQYSDFIRSGMYKNGSLLMTCSSCHDPHARDNVRQLRQDPTDNAASCGSCHVAQANGLSAHLVDKLGLSQALADNKAAIAKCTQCHMPKTAKTGAGRPGISGHWDNDISSHIFDVPRKSDSSLAGTNMATGYTNACGACHSTVN
jgi:predicted CXXCH cytochrome family protein